LRIDSSQVKEYQDTPNVIIKKDKDRANKMSGDDANTI